MKGSTQPPGLAKQPSHMRTLEEKQHVELECREPSRQVSERQTNGARVQRRGPNGFNILRMLTTCKVGTRE